MSLFSMKKNFHQIESSTSKYSYVSLMDFLISSKHWEESTFLLCRLALWISINDCNNNKFEAYNWWFGMNFRNAKPGEGPHSMLVEYFFPHGSVFPSIFFYTKLMLKAIIIKFFNAPLFTMWSKNKSSHVISFFQFLYNRFLMVCFPYNLNQWW